MPTQNSIDSNKPIGVDDGGTGSAALTDGGVLLGSGVGAITALAVGATGNVLTAVTGADPAWAQVDLASMITGILTVPNGGTGLVTITDHSIMVGSGVGSITPLAVGTSGQVIVGSVGADPVFATIGSTDGSISFTPGAGTLAIEGTAASTVQVGSVELTTDAEAIAGTDTTRAVTAEALKAKLGVQTDHGLLVGAGTAAAITSLGVATDGQLLIGSTGMNPALASITSTKDLAITPGAGTISIDLTDNTHDTAIHGWDGAIIETPSITVTSDGAIITFSIEKAGTGDLTVVFSDGFYDWTTAPDTIALTQGSDTSPQINYVYFLQSTKALTVSTSAFPTAEHAPLATVLCQSALSLQTEGAYKLHAWTDHVSNGNGHISHINHWIRHQHATWKSGVAQTLTITPNGGSADNVIFTSASGEVAQLHDHDFPAFSGTPDIYTINDSGTAYNIVTDLNALLTDSTGATMSGKYFTLVIWGVVSESDSDCKLMVNLPGGSYNTQAGLDADSSKFADFSIPTEFVGTGFLIYQMNLRHQASASGTWTSITETSLLGLFPSLAAGGSVSFATEFTDNTFRIVDDGDNTKELAFQVSSVATATTRTITMDDRDIDMDAVPDSFATDGSVATPAAGIATIAGGTNITTSGAGSTVTIDLAATVGISLGGTNASSMATTYGVNYFDGTRLVTTAVGAATHVLTSNGVGVAPTFQAASGGGVASVTAGTNLNDSGTGADPIINLDNSPSVSGSVTAGTGMSITAGDMAIVSGKVTMPVTSSTDGQITLGGNRFMHAYGTDNVFIGSLSGNFTLTQTFNVGVGVTVLQNLTSGNNNVALGHSAMLNMTDGVQNIAIGSDALCIGTSTIRNISLGEDSMKIATTSHRNVSIGVTSLTNLLTGDYNICIGSYSAEADFGAGYAYVADESSNILIGNQGVIGDGNTIRIGTQGSATGEHDTTYIAGIYSVTPGGTQNIALIDSNHQLGSTASLGVALGGTGLTSITDNGVMVGSGTSAVTPLAVGTSGQILVGSSAADPVFANVTAGTGIEVTEGAGTLGLASTGTTVKTETGTTDTWELSDAGKYILYSNAGAITVTVPTNAAVNFPVGTVIGFGQALAGQVTFQGAIPPTLRSADAALTTVKQFSVGYAIKVGTDEWYFGGDLEA